MTNTLEADPRREPPRADSHKCLFGGYKTVGLVCDDVPFVVNALGSERFITLSIGRRFVVYDTKKLTLALMSPPLQHKISAIQAKRDLTFTACGAQVVCWKRVSIRGSITAHAHDVSHLLLLGDLLLSVDVSGVLATHNIHTLQRVNQIHLHTPCSAIMHPDTYLNKVVVGADTGAIELWNIRSAKRVYAYARRSSPVTTISQSPAVDVAAVGLADGTIQILDLRLDHILLTFHQTSRVTSLTFNTDDPRATKGRLAARRALLVSSGADGALAVWDLDAGKSACVISAAHAAAISSAAFLPSEPLLVSASEDNSLKMWIFDQELPKPRLLKHRQGHSLAPVQIRFYGESDNIVSAGRDGALRLFHCWREQQSCALSQKVAAARLPTVHAMAVCPWREKDWPNMVTAHRGEAAVRTWTLQDKRLAQVQLRPDAPRDALLPEATCVAISACGNFALCGTAVGVIYKYNLQSGRPRGHYPAELRYRGGKRRRDAGMMEAVVVVEEEMHAGPVYGVEVDALNSLVVSGGYDGTVRFWEFRTHTLLKRLLLGSPVSHLEINRSAGLVALCCDDLVARAVDLATKEVIRSFRGHTARITDIGISADARWLLSASEDTSVRVWDVPTGRCIEWMEFPESVTSLSLSADGRILAMAHANSPGISLWINNAHFGSAVVHTIATKPTKMLQPADVALEEDELHEHPSLDDDAEFDEPEHEKEMPKDDSRRHDGMITLSTALPQSSKWLSLAYLDLIKKRNKPIEPPKAPASAPFFLPVSKAVRPDFQGAPEGDSKEEEPPLASAGWEDEEEDAISEAMDTEDATSSHVASDKSKSSSRILKRTGFARPRTKLCKLLEEASLRADQLTAEAVEGSGPADTTSEEAEVWQRLQTVYAEVVREVKGMSPSAIDFEIQSLCLGVEDDDGARQVRLTLRWLLVELQAGSNFELIQAYLHRVIHVYKEILQEREELRQLVGQLHSVQAERWRKMRALMQHAQCLIGFFSKQQ